MPSFKKNKESNKWSVVFDLPSDEGKRLQKRLSGYASRREAELAYIAFKGENKIIPAAGLSFEKVYDSFLSYKKTQLKDSSVVDIGTCFDKFILPYLRDKFVNTLSPADLLDWQNIINSKSLSIKYKNKIYGYLKQLYKHTHIFFDVSNNPCIKVEKFRSTEKKKEMQIWTPETFNIFISGVEDPTYHAFFNTLFFSGARPGELIAAKWKDLVDSDLHICETITRKLGKDDRAQGLTWKLTSVKNTSSDRVVTLPKKIVDELQGLKAGYQKKQDVFEYDFIFGSKFPLADTSISREKNRVCKLLGIKPIRNHDFRHSHASLLISLGFDIVSIAKRLGHADIKQTLNTYGHIMPNKQQEMANKLDLI